MRGWSARWSTSWTNRRCALNEGLIASQSSPSQQAVRREQACSWPMPCKGFRKIIAR